MNRLIEINVQPLDADRLSETIDSHEPYSVWRATLDDGRIRLAVLLESEKTEALLDDLESTLTFDREASVVVLPVEASLPRREPEKPSRSSSIDIDPKTGKRPRRARGRIISREELYQNLSTSANTTGVYLVLVVLSTIVAAIGLSRDNVALIIGAMVLAPLLGPNIALALATTLADPGLGIKAVRTTAIGVVVAMALALAIGFMFSVDPTMHELAIRSRAENSDVILALVSGVAGALAFTTGASASLIGVMVAVALLPPLTAVGLFLGAGQYTEALGAAQVLAINVVSLNLAAVATFLIQGVAPRHWWRAEKARRMSITAILIWATLLAALCALLILNPDIQAPTMSEIIE